MMNRLFPSTPNATTPPSATIILVKDKNANNTTDTDTNNVNNNNAGQRQNYCAYSHGDLETACIFSPTCNERDPPCPKSMFCF